MTFRSAKISLAAGLVATLLHGCFTGIENTPRITRKEVIRQDAGVSDEDAFVAGLLPEPFRDWKPGKRLLVDDSRLSLLLSGDKAVVSGDTVIYAGVRQVPAITGDSATILDFSVPARHGNGKISYRLDFPLSQLAGRERFAIPFTVDLDLVDLARRRLVGKELYILTPLWNDRRGNALNGRKYIPVTVTDVVAGNANYPLNVIFASDRYDGGAVMMTAGDTGVTRGFGDIFSFDDPRMRYPSISDEVWQLIVSGGVRAGMTREECRLSLGTPRDIRKGANGAVFFERWTYDNGSYFIFEDGLLTEFRK